MMQPQEMRPGNHYALQAEARRSLGDLIASKSTLVAICHSCKHRRLLFPAVLASRLGGNFPIVDLPRDACAAPNASAMAPPGYTSPRAEPH